MGLISNDFAKRLKSCIKIRSFPFSRKRLVGLNKYACTERK